MTLEKGIIIIGNGSFAELLYFYLREYNPRPVCAFSVHERYRRNGQMECRGTFLPVVALENIEKQYPPAEYDVILGVGYSRMNTVRQGLFHICKGKDYHIASYIHPTAVISEDAELGEGNIVLEKCVVGPFAKIGDGNLLWECVQISHNDVVGSFNTFSVASGLAGFVEVGNNCFFGIHSCVVNGIKLADYSLVGAGACVKCDTKTGDVIVPAKGVILEGKKSTDFAF